MSEHTIQTSALLDDPLKSEEQMAQAQKTWNDLQEHPYVQMLKVAQERQHEEEEGHIHGPFTFLMNQNHNALRGCVSCGQAWVGLMAGELDNLVWHPIGELEEEESE